MAKSAAAEIPFDGTDGALSPARRYMILFTVVLSATLYSTTILIVSTILPQLQGAMSATADEIIWTMTFNILATAVATPTAGWLVARAGKRRVMFWSVLGFSVATYFCGAANSLEELIFWRVVQGALGAPMTPVAQTLTLDTFPKRQHGVAVGLFGIGVVMGAFMGPVIGGVVAEHYTWRGAFYIVAPVGFLATLGITFALPRDKPEGATPLDWTGFLLLSLALASTQLVLSRGQRLDWFDSNEILIETFLAGLAFYLFIAHAMTAKAPFINLRLLRNRNYALGLLLVFIFGMLNFTPMIIMPSLLRDQAGFPDTLIGYVMGSRGFGAMIGFFVAMFIGQKYPRKTMMAGFAAMAIAGAWLMTIDLNVSFTELILNGTVQGLAVGTVWVPLTVATFSTLPAAVRAETSAVYHLVRNIGTSFFISLTVTQIVRSTAINYERMTEMVTPFAKPFALPWVSGAWNTGSAESLARLSEEIARQATMISYLNAFGLYTLVSAAAVPLIFLVSRPAKNEIVNHP
ncbi:MAG TPA: DHA2 family efflux MFS transporter permease subunit [Rhizobiales bacterium]|nr:multidrug export protein EmrB [bacterium BMS3Bbin10]HDO51964.1 DHA2 family efflux MFS transporter permease subunit [Hyphomicrobiales bacterium]